jgi:polyisoprenoid-binding protein YceI
MSTTATIPTTRTWTIDAAHTHVEFAVRHMMVATTKGRFSDVKGAVEFDGVNLSDAKIDVEIGIASVETKQEQRDAHLRSADFFDAENHPAMTFKSKRITADSTGGFQILGDLTIRGVTREITLSAEAHGMVRDPWGLDRAGFSATGKINRHDFGLAYNQALETGGFVVGADVKITLEVELTSPGS